MSIDSTITRRAVLAAGAGGLGAVALAACSSSGGTASGDTSSAQTSPAASTATAAGSGDHSSPAASGSSDDKGGGSGGDDLISLDDIKVGHAVAVQLPGGQPGIVTRTTSTNAVCFSAICTHQGCTVKPASTSLDCPCHGSRYNLKTGAVLNGPAQQPLHKVPVTVNDGKVVTT